MEEDGPAECKVLTPQAAGMRLAITFSWSADTLPHLQVWHDLRPRTCVLSIEPCTSARPEPGRKSEEPVLEAGAVRCYRLGVSIDDQASA